METQVLAEQSGVKGESDRGAGHWSRSLVIPGVYGALFYLLFYLGSYFAIAIGGSLWYPAAGLRGAALLIFGWRQTPSLAAAEFLAVALYGMMRPGTPYGDPGEVLLVVGTPVTYGFAVFLLTRYTPFDTRLRQVRDMAWFSAFAILVPLINAIAGRLLRIHLGKLDPQDFIASTFGFFIGDTIGLLMLTPILLLAWQRYRRPGSRKNPSAAAAAGTGTGKRTVALAVRLLPDVLLIWAFLLLLHQLPVIFTGLTSHIHWYLAFLPMIWISFRHGLTGSIAGSAALTSGSAWLFYLPVESIRFQEMQILVGFLSVTSLLMGSAISTHWRMERELAKQNRALRAVRKQLEARNIDLARFNHTVAHDLRNPLVTIKNFLGRLRQDADRGDLESTRHDLERIEKAADWMQLLLAELFELSRISSRTDLPMAIPFAEIVGDAIDELAEPIAERGVDVEVAEDLPAVLGNREQLLHLVHHLLANAVQYLGDQPSPRIEVGVRHDGKPSAAGKETVFFVRDNGIGIAAEYQGKIFTLFERLTPDSSEGTGIGLALVKRIVEVHGGRIWVESDGVGHGATFCFTLTGTDSAVADGMG